MRSENSYIYTIGHGNRTLGGLLDLLKHFGVRYVADVRSVPMSRFHQHFDRDCLERELKTAGIKYVFMGDSLGGRPNDDTTRSPDGRVDYGVLRSRPYFVGGIKRLHRAYEKRIPIALLCSEMKPETCHRSKLIGQVLLEQGIPVAHIDETGNLVSQRQVLDRLTGGQLSLFDLDDAISQSRKAYKVKQA